MKSPKLYSLKKDLRPLITGTLSYIFDHSP